MPPAMTEDDKIFWNFFVAVTDEFPIMNWDQKNFKFGHVLHLLLGKTFILEGHFWRCSLPCILGQPAIYYTGALSSSFSVLPHKDAVVSVSYSAITVHVT